MKVQDSSRFDNSFWVSFSDLLPFKCVMYIVPLIVLNYKLGFTLNC